ncbi:MAG: hypothetical protein EBR86_15925 [Planctomycetia bacterium]|nr:hypothetical protein [Planctomycetia bacterium]
MGKNLWIGYTGSSGSNLVKVEGPGSTLNVTDAGSEVVVSGSTSGNDNALVLSNSGSANVNSVQLGPGGLLIFGDTGTTPAAAGFIKSTATINGNLGPDPNAGGGVVAFLSTSNVTLPNVLSGPLVLAKIDTATNALTTTTLTGSNTYTGLTFIQAGTLALGPSASIASSSTIGLVSPFATFDVSAVTGGYELESGQLLLGFGTVIGPATGVVGSTVQPGGGVGGTGVLTVTGGFTLLGDLVIDVDGTDIDLLDGSAGGLTLGGSVTFNEVSAPSGNLIFAKYASLTGTFGSVTGLPSGYSIDYNYLSGNQIALVTAIPEIDPASAGSVLAVLGGAVGLLERRLRRRRA